MNDIKRRVAEIVAAGERTLVLHGDGPAGPAASRMLPKLPDVCFTGMDDVEEAARQAAAQGLGKVVVIATADGFPGGFPLEEITTDMGGTPGLAAEVAASDSAARACELWRDAGMLGQCGRELCRRVADRLESAADGVAAQVVLLDEAGERMIGMYGRLRR